MDCGSGKTFQELEVPEIRLAGKVLDLSRPVKWTLGLSGSVVAAREGTVTMALTVLTRRTDRRCGHDCRTKKNRTKLLSIIDGSEQEDERVGHDAQDEARLDLLHL